MDRRIIPLAARKSDIAVIGFFLLNLCFITYIVDIEQIIIPDPSRFAYPLWPPRIFVDLVHWYGRTLDPLVMARPIWWKMTIWIDALVFGPFYAIGVYAYWKGREWIRIPSIIYGTMLITIVIIILGEEAAGAHAAPQLPVVLALNAPWLLAPAWIIYRMARTEHPFTGEVPPARET